MVARTKQGIEALGALNLHDDVHPALSAGFQEVVRIDGEVEFREG